MAKLKLRGNTLIDIGFPQTNAITYALETVKKHYKRETNDRVLALLKEVLADPQQFMGDGIFGKTAEALLTAKKTEARRLNPTRAPFVIYGENGIEPLAKEQLYTALKLPVSKAGALMPDGHAGYGLPIGGVLATENAVIPYGVGVDIGCRMCLTVYDINPSYLEGHKDKYVGILQEHTKFGMSEAHKNPADHEIFERAAFREIPLLKTLKNKAYLQLGSSGGGNHFVEFGIVDVPANDPVFGLPAGKYVGVLSHSGSRGLGANIAKHYTALAMKQTPLPKEARHLAWLDLDTHDGQEYWIAMNLAGDYASACHHDIHRRIAKALSARPLKVVENHHNFAWKEIINGEELIVHRKGATPAQKDVLGIIPGSMTAPGYIVKGLGNAESINSASHGAGRLMSRSQAKQNITMSEVKKVLKDHGVTLLGAGLDEAPMAYKDINKVMAQQSELVDVVGSFTPKIVRMDRG
ncbi:RNA 2',3'-cyclic phosphate--5'-hydroxyl ligase [Flavobacterium akiainvivens]|uniref:3'-phosphate/5'-hydroxy nucleic acid ligase n=1 Tax=Flavobacterium akiainvivens TaxID=1202724 RepID=A0A0M8MBW0_9FLAO|nr:RtcB family protein [Flavobacterium akiainvivens]KOS06885.1 RNA 2',3'-cyclic phosphate--5'-hydroxyl ligase [Flavobacterium akiainvivens]SFQ69472.1 tRNA-splicing ligase RtcB [Flavobacterium akiainvivens]